MIELMVVVAIIAIAAGVAALALRDPEETRLEREAVRLSALLDAARAEARTLGLPARWQPVPTGDPSGDNFRFVGLPPSDPLPTKWLGEGVTAQVVGAPVVRLGPEATIGPQAIQLSLGDKHLLLHTDGIGPFTVADTAGASS
jgi:general secretion pathway protein H